MLHHFPSSAHADATTPVGAARCSCRLPSRTTNGLPLTPGGSAPTLPFSRPAQRSIQISACAVAELLNATLCHRSASNYVVTSSRVGGWRAGFRVRWLIRRFRFGPLSGSLDCVSSPPLIKPDVRISRIRLSCESTPSPTEDPWSSAQV